MDYKKLDGKKFDGGVIAIKAKGDKMAIQLDRSDGRHTLGMIVSGELVKDFGQMTEVTKLIN